MQDEIFPTSGFATFGLYKVLSDRFEAKLFHLYPHRILRSTKIRIRAFFCMTIHMLQPSKGALIFLIFVQ